MTNTARIPRRPAVVGICSIIALLSGACRCDKQPGRDSETDPKVVEAQQANLLSFPDELQVEDNAVNEFVSRAMNTCASGDYQTFRLLWSAREEPLPRSEFEQGWQAVEEIHIRALQYVMLATVSEGDADTGQGVYALLAEVRLDPTHPAAKGEPHREVVLMLVREHEEWRLAHAPRSMRAWIKEMARKSTSSESEPNREPAARKAPE